MGIYREKSGFETWQARKRGSVCGPYNKVVQADLRDVYKGFSRNNACLYFLTCVLGVSECNEMMFSGVRQKAFIRAMLAETDKFEVTKDDYKLIKKDILRLYERIEYVRKIMDKNLYYTEYYPFFEKEGFKLLETKLLDPPEGVPDWGAWDAHVMDEIKERAAAFKTAHPRIVARHIATIGPVLAERKARAEKILAAEKAEKAAEKAARKEERDLEREIKKNAAKTRSSNKKFNSYYHLV